MKIELHKNETRGVSEHGWLSSRFSFSFAEYYNPERMNFGALRVLNDDKVSAGNGFGMHPHRDMEIISIPLYGELTHKDSLGNELTIGPNDVQTMSAGSGVVHSEMNPSHEVDGQFLQIWIQTRQNSIPPAHHHGVFNVADQLNTFVTLVRPDSANGTGLPIYQDAYISRGRFTPGTEVTYTLKQSGNGVYIFLINGSVMIKDQTLEDRDALAITETDSVTINSISNDSSDLLVIEVPML